MIGMYIFAAVILIISGIYGVAIDASNYTGKYQSAIPVFFLMLLFSIVVGVAVSMKVGGDEHIKGYKQGQVDYQNGKIEYRMEIKQKNDSIVVKTK